MALIITLEGEWEGPVENNVRGREEAEWTLWMGSMLRRRSEKLGRKVEEGRWPKTLEGEGTKFFFP